jgi:predicted ATP-grasp superfamily ATP-dependent carboligase
MSRRHSRAPSGRVLVTEGEERAALAACRSLSNAGWEVALAAARRPAAGHWSNACAIRLHTGNPEQSPEGFVDELAAFAVDNACDVVLAGGERSLLLISAHRDCFDAEVRLGLPDCKSVERALDKVYLLQAACAAGLDPPPSHVCTGRTDIARAVDDLGLPVVIKPWRSVMPCEEGLRQYAISVVTTPAELEGPILERPVPCIVQRFDDAAERLSCAGLMTDDGLCGFVVVRFLRTWPPGAGAVSFGETVAVPAQLPERVESLLDGVGWRGIFELELLGIGRKRLAAIDLNPRVFGWLALAVASGVDLPRLWIESLSGRRPRARTARLGVRYRWEDAELGHVARQLRRGNLRAAAAVARPHRAVVHAHFRLQDPGPLAGRMLEVARRRYSGSPAVRGRRSV